MPDEATVEWAIIRGRNTQHAVVVSQESLQAWFECMNRAINVEDLERSSRPWSDEEAILCKRHWCQDQWYMQTSLTDVQRARMRGSLLKIEKELVEPEALS